MKEKLLQVINRCSIFCTPDNTLLFEKGDVIVIHWIPSKKKMYLNDGFVKSLKAQHTTGFTDNEFNHLLKNSIIEAYGLSVEELIYMNDDFSK